MCACSWAARRKNNKRDGLFQAIEFTRRKANNDVATQTLDCGLGVAVTVALADDADMCGSRVFRDRNRSENLR